LYSAHPPARRITRSNKHKNQEEQQNEQHTTTTAKEQLETAIKLPW
jgi:hypothetical protein